MAYGKFLDRISLRFRAALDAISTNYNFDHGDEFEIALASVLRDILPANFGVCRGFVVTVAGDLAGDDIVVFERSRFPSLRFLAQSDLARKEEIPVEAVYAYIEAKNTLHLQGKDENLTRALDQVKRVKKLILSRPDLPLGISSDPYYNNIQINPPPRVIKRQWPDVFNPPFTAIFSRHVAPNSKAAIEQALGSVGLKSEPECPDLFVFGEDLVVVPTVGETENAAHYQSPFFLAESGRYTVNATPASAFGVGLCSILYALDTIRLGVMDYRRLLGDAFGESRDANHAQAEE